MNGQSLHLFFLYVLSEVTSTFLEIFAGINIFGTSLHCGEIDIFKSAF